MDVVVVLTLIVVALAGGFVAGVMLVRQRASHHEGRVRVPQRSKALVKALPQGLVVADARGKVLYLNDRARELAVADSTGAVATPLRDAIHRVLATGEPADVTLDVRRRHSRSTTQLLATVSPVDGDATTAVITVFDAGSPLAARIARREFVVNVSHELKTPIGAISLMSEALDSAADQPDRVREFAGRLRTESQRLAQLVQQFIELSRVQASDTVIESTLLDVRQCIDDAVDGVRDLAAARSVTIDVSAARHAAIRCERRTVSMALRNLLENAIRYSVPQSRVSVTVLEVHGAVEVAIVDQGIGISSADQERIFERFFRADAARDRESGGTGIGLAIVKHVMRQHGGSVKVWSELGVGSTFTLVFPGTEDTGD